MTPSSIPEAPGAWPVLGHLPALIRNPLGFLSSASDHGDLLRLRLGPTTVYLATHPDLVRTMLVSNATDFTRSKGAAGASRFIGPILVAVSGESHRRQRRMMQPGFQREQLKRYVVGMTAAARATADAWRPGQVVDVQKTAADLSLAMITKALFRSDLGATAEAELRVTGHDILKVARLSAIAPKLYAVLPTAAKRNMGRTSAAIREAVAAYRADGRDHGDLLSMMLRAQDAEGLTMTDQEVHDEIMGLAVAGIGGPAALTCWIFHELAHDAVLEQRLHAELDTVLAGRLPTSADLPLLPYTQRLVKEALRMYPGWVGSRRTVRPVRLGGHDVPADVEIMYSSYALQRDARWYRAPERLDPDRWESKETTRDVPKGAWVPFALGTYKCIGDNFALMETAVAVAVIASRWRLRPVPGEAVRPVAKATHVFPNRLRMIAEPRTPAAPRDPAPDTASHSASAPVCDAQPAPDSASACPSAPGSDPASACPAASAPAYPSASATDSASACPSAPPTTPRPR
ncbi:cytochrome P450 [Streptomyces sp. NPDC013455]|uniref:cytochrome P450 n=1 Tax=Streptomyces sp. NPDC013455 TaxID=3155605 RepID=UPI0033DC1C15